MAKDTSDKARQQLERATEQARKAERKRALALVKAQMAEAANEEPTARRAVKRSLRALTAGLKEAA